jgi:hypothetical protein
VFKSIPEHLRPALLIFASVMLVMITAIVLSMMYRDDAVQSEHSAQRAMHIWKNKIEGSRRSDRIVDKYEQEYLKLVKKGVIGKEDRLSWYETIQNVSEARGMPSVKYSVISQKLESTPTLKKKYAGLALYRSVMTLDMTMGHEGDLFALLNGLRDRAKGLFTVDQCELKMYPPKNVDVNVINIDGMEGHCELSWYTIKSAE